MNSSKSFLLFSFFLLFIVVMALTGCGGVAQARPGGTPTPTPSPTPSPTATPSPTPQPALPDHVLVKVGPTGMQYQKFVISDSGLALAADALVLSTPFTLGPLPMASARGVVFALDGANPQVDRFVPDPVLGGFLPGGQVPLQPGVGSFSVDPSGSYLYVNESHDDPPGSYESNLNAFHIEADGTLTQIAGAPFMVIGGPTSGSGCCANVDRLAFTPDGTKAYATLSLSCPCHTSPSTSTALAFFLRDPNSGALAMTAPQVTGPAPLDVLGSVVVAKNGKYLVFPNLNGLMVYSINPANGALTQIVTPSPLPSTDVDHSYSDITITADGEFIYLDQPNSGLIFGVHVEADGSLTSVPGSPYNTGPIGRTTVTNSDQFVVAAGAQELLAFKRDQHTGALIPFGSAPTNGSIWGILNLK